MSASRFRDRLIRKMAVEHVLIAAMIASAFLGRSYAWLTL